MKNEREIVKKKETADCQKITVRQMSVYTCLIDEGEK
jgi:hypothetical protein